MRQPVDETIADEIRAMRRQKPRPTWAVIGKRYGFSGGTARYHAMTLSERRKFNFEKAPLVGRGNKVHSMGKEPPVPPIPVYTPPRDIVRGVPEIERSALWQRMTESERLAYRRSTP